eukprot:gene3946-4200_t
MAARHPVGFTSRAASRSCVTRARQDAITVARFSRTGSSSSSNTSSKQAKKRTERIDAAPDECNGRRNRLDSSSSNSSTTVTRATNADKLHRRGRFPAPQQTVEHETNDLTDIRNKSFQQLQQLVKQYGAKTSVSNLVAMFSRLKSVTWHSQQDKAAVLEQLWLCLEPKLSRCLPRQYAGVASSWMPEVAEVKQLIQRQVIPAFLQQMVDIKVMQTVSNAVYGAALMGLSMPLHLLLRDKPNSMYSSAKPHELSITLYAAQPPEPQSLGMALWSVAKMDMTLPQQQVDQVVEQLMAVLPACQPQTISNAVWGIATMGRKITSQQAEQWLDALLAAGGGSHQAIANTVWALAVMEVNVPTELLQQVYGILAELLPGAETQAVANALWAAASLPEPFLPHQLLTQDNLQLIAAKVPQMTAQELSNIGVACGILGVTDLRLLVPVFDAALQKLNVEGIALPADSSHSAGVQLQPTLESRTADHLFSVDIMCATPTGHLLAIEQREIGHRPRALRLSFASNESLVRRIVNDKCLESHVPASASAFDDVGKHIICAGEDHRLRLWDAHSGVLVKCFDPGHTETITCTAFFPGSNGRSLISAGPARDIRVTDIERAAVRPISSHACHVKSILPLSYAVFASGGDDGTIRCFDSRQRHSSIASSSNDHRSLLVDQRSEAVGRGGSRMSILSMSHDPLNQQYIATAGGDALGVAAAADVSVGQAMSNRLLQQLQQALVQGLGDGAAAGDDNMEVTISAEVHLVGPGGTVLHSTTLPLHSTTASARHRRQAAYSREPDTRQAAPGHGLARQQRRPEEQQLLFLGGPTSLEQQSMRDEHTALLMQAAGQQMQRQGGSLGPLNVLPQPAAHEPQQRLSGGSALPAGGPAQGTTGTPPAVMADDDDSEDETAQPARKRLSLEEVLGMPANAGAAAQADVTAVPSAVVGDGVLNTASAPAPELQSPPLADQQGPATSAQAAPDALPQAAASAPGRWSRLPSDMTRRTRSASSATFLSGRNAASVGPVRGSNRLQQGEATRTLPYRLRMLAALPSAAAEPPVAAAADGIAGRAAGSSVGDVSGQPLPAAAVVQGQQDEQQARAESTASPAETQATAADSIPATAGVEDSIQLDGFTGGARYLAHGASLSGLLPIANLASTVGGSMPSGQQQQQGQQQTHSHSGKLGDGNHSGNSTEVQEADHGVASSGGAGAAAGGGGGGAAAVAAPNPASASFGIVQESQAGPHSRVDTEDQVTDLPTSLGGMGGVFSAMMNMAAAAAVLPPGSAASGFMSARPARDSAEPRSQGQVRQPADGASERGAAEAPADDTLAHTTEGPRVRQFQLDVHGATQLLAAPAAPANPAPAVAEQQSSQCAAADGTVVHEGEYPAAAAGASPAQGELPHPASPAMSDDTEEFEDWLESFDVEWAPGLEPDAAAKGFSCCFGSHGNVLSTKDVCWMGGRSEYVVTGSDNGRLIVWEAATGQVVSVLQGGSKAVRRVKVNPAQQLMVASCGAEPVVRLWSPVAEEPLSQEQTTEQLAAGSGATDASDTRAMAGSLLGMLAHLGERLMGGLFGGLAEADAPGAGGGPGGPRAGGGGGQGGVMGSLFAGAHSGVIDEDEDDDLDGGGDSEAGQD